MLIKEITQKEIDSILNSIASNPSGYLPIRGQLPVRDIPSYMPSESLGIRIPAAQSKPKALSADECQKLFGVSQSVKMNFIPQMLNAVMLQQATLLINYCRDNRVGQLKKHTRVLRTSIEEYVERLAEAYGHMAFRAYLHYVERFQSECAGEIWKMELQADTLCRNQLPGLRHREIASRTLIIVMLISFIHNYDKEMDKLIASKIGMPIHQKRDAYQEIIHAMCLSIGEDMGYRLDPDKSIADWVRILSNKAWHMADDIIREEAES